MYIVTLEELKVILKVNAQAGQSGTVNKTSLESTTQDERDARGISLMIPERQARSRPKSVPIPTAVKQPPKAVPTHNFFAPLRINDMDTETTGTENTLTGAGGSQKIKYAPPIVTTSTANLIRLQSDLTEHVKGEYEFRNRQNGTHIITKEMADYSAMKTYLEKNNLQYFTFSPNSENPIKAVNFPQTHQRKVFPTALRT
jgi:hypothetical protein